MDKLTYTAEELDAVVSRYAPKSEDIEVAIERMADRLAQYERDLHDDIGKDRSQDTDWLRAGFLQRGAEIERLEDGIRALADEMDYSQDSPEIVVKCRYVVNRLRALLDD